MNDNDVSNLISILFSETKSPADALAIYNVIMNRTKNPRLYGQGISGVIRKPKQFSGLNTNEFNKAYNYNLTPQEQNIFNNLAEVILMGQDMPDITNGATNYFNPKLVKPIWANKLEKTLSTSYHDYYR